MQPVYKCDYCNHMGTEEDVAEHEIQCTKNYNRKSCHTCAHKSIQKDNNEWCYQCKIGKDIPKGHLIEFCPNYERKEEEPSIFGNIFGDIFSNH